MRQILKLDSSLSKCTVSRYVGKYVNKRDRKTFTLRDALSSLQERKTIAEDYCLSPIRYGSITKLNMKKAINSVRKTPK